MSKIKKNGVYYLNDSELKDRDQDAFNHKDISDNIINLIETRKSPYNIAIVGKWGLGKSSLIKFVTEYFKVKNNKYVITEINAWKYEKEALRRAFLRQVLLGLGYNEKNSFERLIENLRIYKGKVEGEKFSIKDYFSQWIPMIIVACIMYMIIAIFIFIRSIFLGKEGVIFDFSFIVSTVSSGVYIPIIVVLIDKFISTSSDKYNMNITPPTNSTDDYENKLRDMLSEKKYKDTTVIAVIDDLDRLNPSKIVEALDAIKAFVNYDNCIFIVPFDDAILKKALINNKSNSSDTLSLESDLFLDKLFQYKIYLPNIIMSNIPNYIIQLCHEEIPDFCDLCGKELFDSICREILIHKGVTTPRQAKKIINNYVNNILLAYRREEELLPEGTLTNEFSKKILAKISVIQADYSSFYWNIFKRPNILNELIKVVDSMKIEKEDKLLEPYINISGSLQEGFDVQIKSEYEGLVNFLKRTSNIKIDDISTYLYLSQDSNSILFGDELSKEIQNSVTSGNYQLTRKKILENKDTDFITLLDNILVYAETYEYYNTVLSIINCYDLLNNENTKKLAKHIDDRINTILISKEIINYNEINFKNILNIYMEYK
ncbi:MAG: P-loop NTPase fold protein, partial [Clostridium sp.]|uniref:KAP family P-loop NTPase fold protein n=1 Tax=Clostridium sp. TaxID=1506 RepID=UPI00290FD440